MLHVEHSLKRLGKKKNEFQLVLWTSCCHILLAKCPFLLEVVNDLVRGWLTFTLAHWASELLKLQVQLKLMYFPSKRFYLS